MSLIAVAVWVMKNVHDNDDMMILSAAVYLPMSLHKPGLQQNIANIGDSVPNTNGFNKTGTLIKWQCYI